MLHAIQNGLKLAAADEVKLLNARIEYRRKRMANLRAMQQVLRQHHNEDLRKRAQLLDGLERKLDAAGTDGFDAILDEFERSEHPIETKPVADAPASSERGILKNARRHEGTKARRHEGTKARRSPVEAAAPRSRREKADAAPARAGGNEVLPEESFAMRSQKHL